MPRIFKVRGIYLIFSYYSAYHILLMIVSVIPVLILLQFSGRGYRNLLSDWVDPGIPLRYSRNDIERLNSYYFC